MLRHTHYLRPHARLFGQTLGPIEVPGRGTAEGEPIVVAEERVIVEFAISWRRRRTPALFHMSKSSDNLGPVDRIGVSIVIVAVVVVVDDDLLLLLLLLRSMFLLSSSSWFRSLFFVFGISYPFFFVVVTLGIFFFFSSSSVLPSSFWLSPSSCSLVLSFCRFCFLDVTLPFVYIVSCVFFLAFSLLCPSLILTSNFLWEPILPQSNHPYPAY